MYIAYFVNVISGELFTSHSPKTDKVVGMDGWKRITSAEHNYIEKAIEFYYRK